MDYWGIKFLWTQQWFGSNCKFLFSPFSRKTNSITLSQLSFQLVREYAFFLSGFILSTKGRWEKLNAQNRKFYWTDYAIIHIQSKKQEFYWFIHLFDVLFLISSPRLFWLSYSIIMSLLKKKIVLAYYLTLCFCKYGGIEIFAIKEI